MSADRIKHFEELWEESEQLALKTYADRPNNILFRELTELLQDYENLDRPDSEIHSEIVTSLKKRYMGEIVFLLTAISKTDNINVYAALMEEIKLNS